MQHRSASLGGLGRPCRFIAILSGHTPTLRLVASVTSEPFDMHNCMDAGNWFLDASASPKYVAPSTRLRSSKFTFKGDIANESLCARTGSCSER